jgi:large subunit ribosomal protein L15
MLLSELKPKKGSRKTAKRVGRGRSSGLGKTSGKGHKGQKARSGGAKAPGFEGGQTPIARKFPKRGFNYFGRKNYAVINVGQLENIKIEGELTAEILKKNKVIADVQSGLRVLGSGNLTRVIVLKAVHFSKTAQKKIEAAGGKAQVIK